MCPWPPSPAVAWPRWSRTPRSSSASKQWPPRRASSSSEAPGVRRCSKPNSPPSASASPSSIMTTSSPPTSRPCASGRAAAIGPPPCWTSCPAAPEPRPPTKEHAAMNAPDKFVAQTAADPRHDPSRVIRAPRGSQLSCKSWLTEAPFRMLQNNLDPEVAERPEDLVVYGGIGKAARNWQSFDKILNCLKELEEDQTLMVQSGKPVGILRSHKDAPRVLIANSNLVGRWATWEHFRELEAKGLMMYGQMTAGSWIYIGSQGIVQGTYETYLSLARLHCNGTLKGTLNVTAGLGGMGGAQPLAITMNEGVALVAEVEEWRIKKRIETRYLDKWSDNIDEAIDWA